jgi:hypothetical protein
MPATQRQELAAYRQDIIADVGRLLEKYRSVFDRGAQGID